MSRDRNGRGPGKRPLPRIVVNGPRPGGPVTVVYPSDPDQLRAIIGPMAPMTQDQYEPYRERSEWLVHVGFLCAAMHPELEVEYGGFLTDDGRVCAVIWCSPPVVVLEMPIQAIADAPPETKRPIYGPHGQQIN